MIRYAALVVLFLVAWTQTAQADFSQEVRWCDFGGTHPDIRIVACTRNIQSGRFTGGNLAQAFTNRGLAYKTKGLWDKAIRLKPDLAQAFSNRGNVYRKKGRFDRAIRDYDEAIRLKPDNAQVFADRGLSYEKKGELTQALRDFKKAHALGFRHLLLLKKLREVGELL